MSLKILRTGEVISIHALREEGDLAAVDSKSILAISIHALREEGDPTRWAMSCHSE